MVGQVKPEEEAEALELDLEERRERKFRLWYLLAAVGVGLILGVVLAFVFVSKASQGQRGATCAVVEASRKEKMAQLREYEANPPTTDLARNLQETYRDSLATWDRLWSTLGCKDSAPPGP